MAQAEGKCVWSGDYAQNHLCFVAQFPCYAEYFGAGQPQDYPAALKCFERETGPDSEAWGFLALMYFNGEGTARNLTKAASMLGRGQQNAKYSFYYEPLAKALNSCRRNPSRRCRKLDFCKDVGFSTFDMEICSALDEIRENAKLSRTLESIRQGLNAQDRLTFDRAIAEFNAYRLAEASRVYDIYFDGTIRGLAADGQAVFIRDNLEKLLARSVQTHNFNVACADSAATADHEVDERYQINLRRNLEDWRQEAKEVLPDMKRATFENIDDYQKVAADSQRHWVMYETAMAELAKHLDRPASSACNAGNGMRLAIAKNRMTELRYNPVGPEFSY